LPFPPPVKERKIAEDDSEGVVKPKNLLTAPDKMIQE